MRRLLALCTLLLLAACNNGPSGFSYRTDGVYFYVSGGVVPSCDVTAAPPATFTPIPSPTIEVWTPTPTATAPPCVLTVTEPRGLNKRAEPSTGAAVLYTLGVGARLVVDDVAEGDQYLWAHDVSAPAGWVAVRSRGAWWVSGGNGCTLDF